MYIYINIYISVYTNIGFLRETWNHGWAEMWTWVKLIGLESDWSHDFDDFILRLDKITHYLRLDLDLTAIDLRLARTLPLWLVWLDMSWVKNIYCLRYLTYFPPGGLDTQDAFTFVKMIRKKNSEQRQIHTSSIISKRNFDIIYTLFRITVLVHISCIFEFVPLKPSGQPLTLKTL